MNIGLWSNEYLALCSDIDEYFFYKFDREIDLDLVWIHEENYEICVWIVSELCPQLRP